MASKLDYLKKYLAKPGDASADVKKTKKEKDKKSRKCGDSSSLRIRDLSEVLPQSRQAKASTGRRPALGHLGIDDLGPYEDDIEYVDEKLVEAAKKVEDTSGVRWKISQHRDGGGPRRSSVEVKKEVKEEVKLEGSDDDISPPRAAPRASGNDLSPPRGRPMAPTGVKREEASDEDLSPPRAGGAAQAVKAGGSDDDISPPRAGARQRHDSDEDLSPPRQAAVKPSSQPAGKPLARQRHDSDASDLSPTRLVPARPAAKSGGRQRHDSDASDLSPPRGAANAPTARQRHDSDASDLSPPRPGGSGKPSLAKKRRQRHDSDGSASEDLSPPRGGGQGGGGDEDDKEKMTSGLRAGLVQGEALKAEAAAVRAKRQEELAAAPDNETGRGAETVYRSRDLVTKISREQWASDQQKKKKKRLSEYPEQELEWGGGLKQGQNREAEMEDLSRIAAQPFARYEPDQRYMEELKKKSDWNDPMRKAMEEKDEARGACGSTAGMSAAAAAAAEAKRNKPKCPHPPWLNRFGILPGYRWDGKIRSNGYERRWLENKNHKEFKKKEAWEWDELNS